MKRNRSGSSSVSTSTESNLKKQKSHKRTSSNSSEEASKSKRRDGATKHGPRKSSEAATAGPSEDARIKRKKKKKHKKIKKEKESAIKTTKNQTAEECLNVPVELMDKSKSYAPMTKEEWDKQQSVVRKVYDEASGRHRLIKGDGEVIEGIVSKDRHTAINEQATRGDGIYFQAQLSQQK